MSADRLHLVKFMLTHAGFGLIALLLLAPKLIGHHRALHSTNALIALWTIALGEILHMPLDQCEPSFPTIEFVPARRASNQELRQNAGLHGTDAV